MKTQKPAPEPASDPLTPAQAAAILRTDADNMTAKVEAGGLLSTSERKHLVNLAMGGDSSAPAFIPNVAALATLLGVDRRTINRWKKQKGAPVTGPNGRYEVAAWRAFKSTRPAGHRDGDEDPMGEKHRQTRLQNEKLAVQVEILKKEWIRVDVVVAEAGQVVTRAKQVLLRIPSALAPQVVGCSVVEAEALLREAINDAIAQLHFDPAGSAGIQGHGEGMEA